MNIALETGYARDGMETIVLNGTAPHGRKVHQHIMTSTAQNGIVQIGMANHAETGHA